MSQSTTWQYDGFGAWTNASNWNPASSNQNNRNQYTNWDGALDQANDTKPRLIVFITDGDPTAVNLDQDRGSPQGLGYNTFRGDGSRRTVNRAIEEANTAKTNGTRILTVGVGNGLSTPLARSASRPFPGRKS